jgi:hypothetical protein
MIVPYVLNCIHVVYFELPDDRNSYKIEPSRIYKEANGVVAHLTSGQSITSPPDFNERPVQKQTITGHPLYRLWEYWFEDSPHIRLRHFMMKEGVPQPNADQSIFNNTNQTNGYAQQHWNEMQVNDTGAGIAELQPMYDQPQPQHEQSACCYHYASLSNDMNEVDMENTECVTIVQQLLIISILAPILMDIVSTWNQNPGNYKENTLRYGY